MILLLFYIGLLFIVYTYLLYPLVIVLAAKLRANPSFSGDADVGISSITMIIIAHNEERVILDKLENCRGLDYPKELLTICIVSDGSTDRTAEILSNQEDILFIEDKVNRGKPFQLNNAVKQCESDLVVFSDARQMYEPSALRKLERNFADPQVGAVSGELIFVSSEDATEKSVGLYWKYEKVLRKAESDIDSTLGVTGAIYAIRRDLIESIPDDTILDDIEIPLRAFKKGYRIMFEDEAIAYDAASTEIKAEFTRKSRTLAGNFQLFDRNPWLLNPLQNRIFFQTISHKLFRLFVPYSMLLVLVTSFLVNGISFRFLFWIQVIGYAGGLAALVSKRLRKNRLANFISVFISLNAASVYALYSYSSGKTDARWKKRNG